MKWSYIVLFVLGNSFNGFSQNYHAIHGSSFEASLNVNNNPATIINTPYSWDVTVFGAQLKSISNAFTVHNYSLLSSPANSEYSVNDGVYSRKSDLNYNINLLNTRIALSRTKALAFGINVKGYANVKTDPYNYIDTIHDINNFLLINGDLTHYNGSVRSSGWIEIFATYSQTVWDDETSRLNAGVTLKVNRGVSGAFANIDNVIVQKDIQPTRINYLLQSGAVDYGYSSNFDRWQDEKSSSQNIRDLVKYTEGGASIDLGLEYIIKPRYVHTYYDEDDGYYQYEWKFGLSLLDVGRAMYKYGNKSRRGSDPVKNVTAGALENKFLGISDFEEFNDSLSTLVNNFSQYNGRFNVVNPARMVMNVDRHLRDDFYLNGELSVNLSPLAGDKRMYVREMSLLTVTPRWETKRWGAYLPVQYTQGGEFWIGAAFKAGPVLLGFHNLGNVFAKNKMQNGGGYLAIIIHSGKKTEAKRYRKVDCPSPL